MSKDLTAETSCGVSDYENSLEEGRKGYVRTPAQPKSLTDPDLAGKIYPVQITRDGVTEVWSAELPE